MFLVILLPGMDIVYLLDLSSIQQVRLKGGIYKKCEKSTHFELPLVWNFPHFLFFRFEYFPKYISFFIVLTMWTFGRQ